MRSIGSDWPPGDGAISDGCGDSYWHGFCFSGGYGFRLAAPAYSSGTCRVRVTTRETYTAPVHYPITLIPMDAELREALTALGLRTAYATRWNPVNGRGEIISRRWR